MKSILYRLRSRSTAPGRAIDAAPIRTAANKAKETPDERRPHDEFRSEQVRCCRQLRAAGQRASGQASGVGTHVDIAEQRHQRVPFLQNH